MFASIGKSLDASLSKGDFVKLMTLHGALCGFLVKRADTRLSMSLRSCGTSAVTDVVGIGTHAHCSMNDIPCHALSTHALQMGVVQERASDSHTLKIMYCYR